MTWRWIFYVNLPIAAAVLAAGWRLLGMERRDRRVIAEAEILRNAHGEVEPELGSNRVDWAGALLLGRCTYRPLFSADFLPTFGAGETA
jgi:hypothetical protein